MQNIFIVGLYFSILARKPCPGGGTDPDTCKTYSKNGLTCYWELIISDGPPCFTTGEFQQ